MKKYSEWIHEKYSLSDFETTGNLETDCERYRKFKGMASEYSRMDPSIVKDVVFRLSFGKRFTVHTLTDGVVEKIKHTRIENIPKEIPVFMKNSFLIEARHDKNLFGNIRSIGGFMANNELNLIIVTDEEKDNHFSQTLPASFDGRKLEDINMMYKKETDIPHLIFMKERKDIFSFALKLSLMMEAERTPLAVETANRKKQGKSKPNPREATDWIEKRVYIDKTIKYQKKGSTKGALDKDGKFLKETLVHGFPRLQRFGKGLSESKWVYIDDYGSSRWVSPGDARITVDIYGDK
jgi:hypothetical protein